MALSISLLMFSLISSLSYAAVQDFCVADYTAPTGPSGYTCKRTDNVTVNDFVFSGLGVPGKTTNVAKAAVTPVSSAQLPGLNGLGISVGRIDLAPGGIGPLHAHPRATEIILVTQGTLIAGFVSSDRNTVYVRTIKTGDLMVCPQGLLHFAVNIGHTPFVGYASYSSENPGLQIVDFALFRNNFPSQLIAATTFISPREIKRLRYLFGGTY